MELVKGQTLNKYSKTRELSIKEIIDLAVQICKGLKEAHTNGIIHRDIKPGNILVSESDRPKLVDFGLARFKESDDLTKTGSTIGTFGYMSPEQVSGKAVDERSDIFSFGIMLYELFAGRRPFYKDNMAATGNAILYETPEPLARYRTGISDELQRIISKSLEKKADDRYQHVDDLLVDLKREQCKIDLQKSGQDETTEKYRVRQSRHKRNLLSALFIIVIGLAVLMINPVSRQAILEWAGVVSVPGKKHLVVLPFVNISNTADSQLFCDGLMETISSKLTFLEQFQNSMSIVPASEVRARNISSIRSARKAFGVTLAVTGSIQRMSNKVRVTLNLSNAKTERQLKSFITDDKLVNLVALQDSIVIKIVEMLDLVLKPRQRQALMAGGTTESGACDLYLKGRGYLYRRYEATARIDSAIELFREAISIDNNYALANAGLGEAYMVKYIVTGDPPLVEMSIENCEKALKLDGKLSPALNTLGSISLLFTAFGESEPSLPNL